MPAAGPLAGNDLPLQTATARLQTVRRNGQSVRSEAGVNRRNGMAAPRGRMAQLRYCMGWPDSGFGGWLNGLTGAAARENPMETAR